LATGGPFSLREREAEMTYQGYNPAGMPGAETSFTAIYPEIKAPVMEGEDPEARSSDA
jgi:hypothetical protein